MRKRICQCECDVCVCVSVMCVCVCVCVCRLCGCSIHTCTCTPRAQVSNIIVHDGHNTDNEALSVYTLTLHTGLLCCLLKDLVQR